MEQLKLVCLSRETALPRRFASKPPLMKILLLVVGWCLLFVLSWPIALLALVLAPLVWLMSLPFVLLGIALGGVFALLRAIVMLPARLLGHRG
jgi:drug/metabolite transporter (DMT)-like permease